MDKIKWNKDTKSFSNSFDKLFTKYTDLDSKVISIFNKYNYYLMGGTAIEFYLNSIGIKGWRSRSDNDLDFTAKMKDLMSLPKILSELKSLDIYCVAKSLTYYKLKGKGIEVDILFDLDENLSDINELLGIKLVSPRYIIQTKLDRLGKIGIEDDRGKKDLLDIRDILLYIKKPNTKLPKLNDPNNFVNKINKLI